MAGIRQQVISVPSMAVNAFIVRGQRSIIVDTGIPGYEDKILKAMDEKGIKPADISLILITHGHHDHYGSAFTLKKKTGVPIAIHKADSEPLQTGVNPALIPIGATGKIMVGLSKVIKMPETEGMDADILIEGEMDLAPYGIAGRVVPTPGHTRGSVSVSSMEGAP